MGGETSKQLNEEAPIQKRKLVLGQLSSNSPLLNDNLLKELKKLEELYGPRSEFEKLVAAAEPVEPSPLLREYMQLRGWLDLDLSDPELAPLFKK